MLKSHTDQYIELNRGKEEPTTSTTKKTNINSKHSPAKVLNETIAMTTVHTNICQTPNIHLAPISALISSPKKPYSAPVHLVDDDDDDDDGISDMATDTSESFKSEFRLNSYAADVKVPMTGSSSTSTFKSIKDQTNMQKHSMKVAGPQQQQQQQRLLQENKLQKQQNPCEKVFPHVATMHQKLRSLLARPISNAIQQQMLKAINAYIVGCRNEYEESTASPYKCRRLAHSITRTMDLMQHMCASFEDTPEYVHRMIELIAVYLSCELRYAKEFKEHKPLIANRILHNIYKYLKGNNRDETISYILRMFAHVPRLYREREVMTKIFQTLIPKEQVIMQRELPDNLYIQYIIVFFHWKQLEINHEEQMRVIEFANQFMRPAKTLCTNSTYAYHLPNYTCTQTATKFILHDLKFFHDLRNASIYDHRLQLGADVIDIAADEEQSKTPKPSVDINFAELVKNSEIRPTLRPMVKQESQIVIATIDLTLEDKKDNDVEWLEELQRNAKKLEPSRNGLSMLAGRNANAARKDKAAAANEVIEIDSDSADDEEDNDELEEPENLLLEEPEQLSENFLEFEEGDHDDQDVMVEASLDERKAMHVKSQQKADINKQIAIEEISNDAAPTSFHHSSQQQQQKQDFPTKLNIISVRSIAATQTEENTDDVLPVPMRVKKKQITTETSPIKTQTLSESRAAITAQTQTDESYCESVFGKTVNATINACDLLPSKPTIIEVRSIANKNKLDYNFPSAVSNSELEPTQVNSQISKALNAGVVINSGKQVMSSSARNERRYSRMDDNFSCRRDSLHLSSSPVRHIGGGGIDLNDSVVQIDTDNNDAVDSDDEADEDDDNEDMCFFGSNSRKPPRMGPKSVVANEGFSSNKVIYSVAASTCPPLHQDSTDFVSDDDMTFKQRIPVRTPAQKKLVKFSNKPLQRTAIGKPITYPIKPALKNSNNSTFNINQPQSAAINSVVSRFGSASPASSTSSLPRTLSKEHLSAFRDHYTDAEKRQVLHRQSLPSHLRRTIKKNRPIPTIAPSYSSSSSSNDGPPCAPMKLTCKEMLLAAGAPTTTITTSKSRSLHTYIATHYPDLDENLRKKCCVVIERNHELDRNMVQSLNRLLEMQREKRQRALEKRQEEERQRVLKSKLLEEQMLKEQITELRRQQEVKKAKRRKSENSKRKVLKTYAMRMQNKREELQAHRQTPNGSAEHGRNAENNVPRAMIGFSNEIFLSGEAEFKPQTEMTTVRNENEINEITVEERKEAEEEQEQEQEQQQEQGREEEEEVNEEEIERMLLRTPTPERSLYASITPQSAIKPVKVRIKRSWKKNRRVSELLEKEKNEHIEYVEEEGEEHDQDNQAEEITDTEVERIRQMVLTAKNSARSQLQTENMSCMYEPVSDDEGLESEENEKEKNDDNDLDTAMLNSSSKESEATPLLDERYDEEEPRGSPIVSEPTNAVRVRRETESSAETALTCGLAMLANTAATAAFAETPIQDSLSVAKQVVVLPVDSIPSTSKAAASAIVEPSTEESSREAFPEDSLPSTSEIASVSTEPLAQASLSESLPEDALPSTSVAKTAKASSEASAQESLSKALPEDALPSTSAAAAIIIAKERNKFPTNNQDKENSNSSAQNMAKCSRASELAAVEDEANVNAVENESHLSLNNFEANRTSAPYLLNGESRDVPTPTHMLTLEIPANYASAAPSQDFPSAESSPTIASVDSTHAPDEPEDEAPLSSTSVAAATAPETSVNNTLSTSDHEVSSTQETLCETLQLRNTNHSNTLMTSAPSGRLSAARRMSLFSVSAALSSVTVSAAVQNNQVDTTHHLPESTTTISSIIRSSTRRRVRKLTISEEISTDVENEQNKQRPQPVNKRRKTICADASFRLHLPIEPLMPIAETEPLYATSPSTTTVSEDKAITRKRGRPPPLAATVPKRKPNVRGPNSTPSPLPKIVVDSIDIAPIKSVSPEVPKKSKAKKMRMTSSRNNLVRNVLVPPYIETSKAPSKAATPELRYIASTASLTSSISALSLSSSPSSGIASPIGKRRIPKPTIKSTAANISAGNKGAANKIVETKSVTTKTGTKKNAGIKTANPKSASSKTATINTAITKEKSKVNTVKDTKVKFVLNETEDVVPIGRSSAIGGEKNDKKEKRLTQKQQKQQQQQKQQEEQLKQEQLKQEQLIKQQPKQQQKQKQQQQKQQLLLPPPQEPHHPQEQKQKIIRNSTSVRRKR